MGSTLVMESKPWILLLTTLAVVHSQRIFTFRGFPSTGLTLDSPSSSCETQCAEHYPAETKEGLQDRCETGCRLFNIIERVDSNQIGGVEEKNKNTDELANCKKSCVESYSAEDLACKKGCELQLPLANQRRNSINSVLDNFFGGGDGFPKIRIGFPSQENNGQENNGLSGIFNSMPNFSEMFDKMRNHMNDMMNHMMKEVDGKSGPMGGSNGRMVIIKSGPGYHQEKTYDFGPNGMKTEVKSSGQQMQNDMMSEMNPLEKFFNNGMVEMFKPKIETKENEIEAKDTEVIGDIAREVAKEVAEHENSRDDFSSVHGFDFDGPRLPEEGLRTRLMFPTARHVQLVCSQDSDNMKWSDWMTCLHIRMGLPRWLTAATISLGIVFIIWLCLVIPQNAPKQKVKKTKAMEAAGQLEKDRLNLIMAKPVKLDLPPSYEDIANLHVAVPIVNDQAEPLPEKKSLEEEKA